MTKIIQSGEILGSTIGKLGKEAPTSLTVPLAKDALPKLATKPTSSILENLKEKQADKEL